LHALLVSIRTNKTPEQQNYLMLHRTVRRYERVRVPPVTWPASLRTAPDRLPQDRYQRRIRVRSFSSSRAVFP